MPKQAGRLLGDAQGPYLVVIRELDYEACFCGDFNCGGPGYSLK